MKLNNLMERTEYILRMFNFNTERFSLFAYYVYVLFLNVFKVNTDSLIIDIFQPFFHSLTLVKIFLRSFFSSQDNSSLAFKFSIFSDN